MKLVILSDTRSNVIIVIISEPFKTFKCIDLFISAYYYVISVVILSAQHIDEFHCVYNNNKYRKSDTIITKTEKRLQTVALIMMLASL